MKYFPPYIFRRSSWKILFMAAMLQTYVFANLGDPIPGWPITRTGEIIFGAPAVGPHGSVVFGTKSGDIDLPGGPDGNVYCYNPNGTVKWVFSGTDWFEGSPAIAADGTVYIGGWDNFLYAFSGQTGVKLWDFPTGSAITASPAIGPDGTIYIGSTDGTMYALWPDSQVRWTYETDPDLLSPVYGGAVLSHSGNTVYFGDGDGTFHAVNASTGDPEWTYSVPPEHDLYINPGARAIQAAPAIDSAGNIYFGCENGYFYMLTPEGALKNAFGTSDSILSSPIIDSSDRIYFSSRDTYMYCLAPDITGMLDSVWETYVGDVLYSTPAMDAIENIFVAGYTGNSTIGIATTFSFLNSAGSVLWSSAPIASLNDSAPNISPDGSIYIGAYNGKMYKLAGAAPLSIHGWPRQSASRRQTGSSSDLTYFDLIDYFPDIRYDLQGLSYVPWFGSGFISEVDLPTINHIDHGDLLIGQSGPAGVIMYDLSLYTWMFAFRQQQNVYYHYSTGKWLYHVIGTTVNDTRWFFDFSQDKWITEYDLD